MRMRNKAGICKASCNTPPMNTAQASASTGGSKQGAAKSAMPMKLRLSSTGVKAGMAKRLQVFNMPAAIAVRDMKKI